MISIGIDQSYTSTGYCILNNEDVIEYGTLSSHKSLDIHERVFNLTNDILDILSKYPDAKITIEGLAFGIRGNATRDLAGLQFVIINNIKRIFNKKIDIIPPTALKKFATGSGGGKKKVTKKDMFDALPLDIQQAFKTKHKASTGLYDITDAYWLAKYFKTEETK